MVYGDTISKQARKDLEILVSSGLLKNFYLAGGTGLALHLGHRESVDLDFFSQDKFDENRYLENIPTLGSFELQNKETHTLTGRFNNTLLTLLHYGYPLLEKTTRWEGIEIGSVIDIACMKLDAAATRGSKKDFIDIYFILKNGGHTFADLFSAFSRKYAEVNYNLMHIKKSLVYFANAESDPMPLMHIPTDWNAVKKFFESEVLKI